MIKKQLFMLITLGIVLFWGCNDSNSKSSLAPEAEDIQLEITLERDTTSNHPLDVIVKLTNSSNNTVYYDDQLREPILLKDYFIILEDGIELKYQKPISVNPSGTAFAPIDAHTTQIVNTIALDKLYNANMGLHHYKISLRSKKILAKTADDEFEPNTTESSSTKDEFTSKLVSITSNIIEFNATITNIRNY